MKKMRDKHIKHQTETKKQKETKMEGKRTTAEKEGSARVNTGKSAASVSTSTSCEIETSFCSSLATYPNTHTAVCWKAPGLISSGGQFPPGWE